MAAVGVALFIFGLLAALIWMVLPAGAGAAGPPSAASALLARWRRRFSPRVRARLLVGLGAGVVVAALSGWVVFVLLAPLVAAGAPSIFSDRAERAQTEKLSALEAWARSLSGLIITGTSLETALAASLTNAGAPIYRYVSLLVARLEGGWQTTAALQAFADDLDDPTGDLVVMNLVLAARQRGAGLATALEDLAGTVQEEVKIRREISADRSKPRLNAKIVMGITVLMLVCMPLVGTFAEPYRTPLGQLFYAGWVGLIVLVLLYMRRLVMPRPAGRLMTAREGA